MIFHPGMIRRRVVRHEIEHQTQAAIPQALTQTGKCRVTAEILVHGVAGDREPRAGYVLLPEVGQCLLKLVTPLLIGARDLLCGFPRLPHAQEPDPIEAHPGQVIEFDVRYVVERGSTTESLRQLRQPDTGVDLVERWVAGCLHISPCSKGHTATLSVRVNEAPVRIVNLWILI